MKGSDALIITDQLFEAKCFSRIGDKAVLDITGELEGFQTVAVVEVVGDVFAMLLHLFELFEYNQSGDQVEPNLITTAAFAFSIVIDFSEFLLAVLSLFQYLLSAIDGFYGLYYSMNDPNPAAASAVTALPCFYTSCTHGGVCSSITVGDASTSQTSSMPIWAVLLVVVVVPFLSCAVAYQRYGADQGFQTTTALNHAGGGVELQSRGLEAQLEASRQEAEAAQKEAEAAQKALVAHKEKAIAEQKALVAQREKAVAAQKAAERKLAQAVQEETAGEGLPPPPPSGARGPWQAVVSYYYDKERNARLIRALFEEADQTVKVADLIDGQCYTFTTGGARVGDRFDSVTNVSPELRIG